MFHIQREKEGDHIRHQGMPFEVDCWYPLCSEITFPTVYLNISRETAASVCRFIAHRFFHRDFPSQSGHFFSRSDVTLLNDLEHRIDTLLKENAHLFPHGVFIRLAGRSPKDADPALNIIANLKEQFAADVHNLSEMYGYSEEDPTTQFMALGRLPWMRVTNATEAMCIILSSERVYADFADWLQYGTPEILCFRAWCPELRGDREFRLYICHGKLNAISQYDHLCCYPHLLPYRKALFNNLVGFWRDQVQPRFSKVLNYSVDFSITCEAKDLSEEYKKENVVLLEFSPFVETTGSCIFSWKNPEDVAIFCGDGHKDDEDYLPEMRLKEKQTERVEDMLDVGWNRRWTYAEDYKNLYSEAVEEKGLFGRLWDKAFGHKPPVAESLVFVCDGLQRGHIWFKRYMELGSKFVGCATTEGFTISIDPVSGAPELIKKESGRVKGEVFAVQDEYVIDLDMLYN